MGCFICAISWITSFALLFFAPLIFLTVIVRTRLRKQRNTVAFFHPYCNAGGGGERVLWIAVNAMQKQYADKGLTCVIYTGDNDARPDDILDRAKNRFDIVVDERKLHFVYLRTRRWLEARNYPHFTLALQTLAALIVGIEALCNLNPEVFIDTMGYPMTMPLFKWVAGSKVGCYVHYPVVSADMIKSVESREARFNNAEWISSSWLFSLCKLIYYRIFAFFYGLCGKCADVVMVNGSWTRNHILELWRMPERTFVVYPPCNVHAFLRLKSEAESMLEEKKLLQIISVGQIRPEKDHRLQICTLAELKKKLKTDGSLYTVRLVICGGCRHEEDWQRVDELKKYAKQLGLDDDDIEWALNVNIERLYAIMQKSLIGFHTMHSEHFGISVVEGVAAGHMMVAHNSGGPKLDILNATTPNEEHRIGFLATSMHEYVDCVMKILHMTPAARARIRENGKEFVKKFSDENFEIRWNSAIDRLLCGN
uniref:GDP-Man:Man(3)GlcNAc(2)-PP-Dol alpha-1,2-mannosyltransferase n=1 Tax=Ascaris suum TaxID=6253 RepID=F1L3K1_ASCSU